MIPQLLTFFIPVNLITSYILLDEQQSRTFPLKSKTFFALLGIQAILFGCASVLNYPIVKTVVMIALNVSIGFCIFHHRKLQLVNDAFFALAVGICELLILPVVQVLGTYFTLTVTNAIWYITCSMLFVQLFAFYMYHLYRKMRYQEHEENTGFALLNFIFLPLFSFVNILIIATISQFYMYTWILIASVLDVLFIIFLNIYLSYVYHSMVQSHKLKQELALAEQKNELQYAYYQRLEENYQKSRQLIHDVKRHLQMMKVREEDYRDEFQNYLDQFAMPVFSNHRILNMILSEKMQEAQKEHISFTCESCMLPLDFMKDMDVTVIFLNLLDNAMDACRECENDRWIHWKADRIQQFLVIEISNSSARIPRENLVTSKTSHEGLGLKNVSQTLETYGGNMQVEFDDTRFAVHLYIPVD